MSAKATGANPSNGSAEKRDHHDGSSTRAFTTEQKAAVVRIRRCGPTAFYDILGLEAEKSSVSAAGIKKAYHKLSLLTHPDKNGYTGSDEAFKMVSRAFQILSDPDKKSRYDQFGGDPDNRFASAQSAAASNPFAGFARAQRPGAGFGMRPGAAAFEAEISPEELFRQFFGGGGGGGFGGFGGFDGPGFVFGGPGVRVHQFGGGRPRARPPGTGGGQQQPPTAGAALLNLLPIVLFFLLPLLSSLLGSGGAPWSSPSFSPPRFNVDRARPPDLTAARVSKPLGVEYFVAPASVAALDADRKAWSAMDAHVERYLVNGLNRDCANEQARRQKMHDDAHGWFAVDAEALRAAREMPMPGCERLQGLTRRSGGSGWL